MTEPKFTPGPWTLPHFARPDVNCQCEYVLCDHLMGAVASVHCSGDGDDWAKSGDNPKFQEAVANAHLIAAAPQMYEALRATLNAGRGSSGRIILDPEQEAVVVAALSAAAGEDA